MGVDPYGRVEPVVVVVVVMVVIGSQTVPRKLQLTALILLPRRKR